jgi:hypothetical protein
MLQKSVVKKSVLEAAPGWWWKGRQIIYLFVTPLFIHSFTKSP